MTQRIRSYTANLHKRLEELALPTDLTADNSVEVKYTWRGGYETLEITGEDRGGYHYAGSYHPEGFCEGGGVCIYCGRTLEFD